MTESELAAVRKAAKGHTPGPWHWGDGWDKPHTVGEDGDCEKYMSMQLLGFNDAEIIPIRIDHREPIWDVDESCDQPHDADRALIAAAPALLAHIDSGWTPVSEKRPNRAGRYLITIQHEKDDQPWVCIDDYGNDGKWGEEGHGWVVLAWKRLPEPYRGGEK